MLRFIASLAALWVAAWLPIGLWVGDPDYVLTQVSRGTIHRQIYQAILYGGLVLLFWDSWRRHRPARPRWGKWSQFAFYFVQGLIASVVLRFCLHMTESASWSSKFDEALVVLQLVLSCLVVALAEEAIFRGVLLGNLVGSLGWRRGVLVTSALFAVVHLFRPGGLGFKIGYGIGLFILGYLLARIAWHHNSILASAGFHGGVILLNLGLTQEQFRDSWYAGWNGEPVAGGISIGLTLLFLCGWHLAAGKGLLPDSGSKRGNP